jgi:hypothetical protein
MWEVAAEIVASKRRKYSANLRGRVLMKYIAACTTVAME